MTTSTLLGYLARFASFTTQSEVLCTQGLAYLLETYEEARLALAGEVKARTSIGIGNSIEWIPESSQKDGGRPDLEARKADEVPVVKIEAKLGAQLLPAQLRSYVKDFLERNSGESALLVLVPKTRSEEAAQITAKAFGLSGSAPWRFDDARSSGVVVISVVSWDELFVALENGEAERFRYELAQLKAMYCELSSDFIAPLASDEDLRDWRSSETDFLKLIDQVTRRLTKQHRTYPFQTESYERATPESEPVEHRLRYVCPCSDDATSCYSIGVRESFAEWVTPVWMRFHKDTGDFSDIRRRIESSDLRRLTSSGHIWIPLDVPRDVSGEEMVEKLVEQAEDVIRVAYRAE
jgi:hypothetical protein